MLKVDRSIAERVVVGMRFGNLTVLGLHGKDKSRRAWHHACSCDCGREVLVATCDLLSGSRRSCRANRPCNRWSQNVKVPGSNVWAAQKLANMRNASKKYGYAEPVGSVSLVLDLWSLCEGRCECCGLEGETSLHLDHCHVTGKLRGFICRSCNIAIGFARDQPSRLFAMAAWVASQPA